jgi:hypothetical protein
MIVYLLELLICKFGLVRLKCFRDFASVFRFALLVNSAKDDSPLRVDQADERLWFKALGLYPPLLTLALFREAGRLIKSNVELETSSLVGEEAAHFDRSVRVCAGTMLVTRGHISFGVSPKRLKLRFNGISELTDRVFPKKPEIPIQKTVQSLQRILRGVIHG